MDNTQKEIEEIKTRNQRVEADKAWETSKTRIVILVLITYILATLVMYIIGVENPHLNSLIPTLGFVLSVQSLPFFKKIWLKYSYNRT